MDSVPFSVHWEMAIDSASTTVAATEELIDATRRDLFLSSDAFVTDSKAVLRLKIGRGPSPCCRSQYHKMLFVQTIIVETPHIGLGTAVCLRLEAEAARQGMCFAIECPVTAAGRGLVKSLKMTEVNQSNVFVRCCYP